MHEDWYGQPGREGIIQMSKTKGELEGVNREPGPAPPQRILQAGALVGRGAFVVNVKTSGSFWKGGEITQRAQL